MNSIPCPSAYESPPPPPPPVTSIAPFASNCKPEPNLAEISLLASIPIPSPAVYVEPPAGIVMTLSDSRK